MKDLLYYKDAYEPVTGTKPDNITDGVWATSNQKIVTLIW
jgi:hypothetical protein